MSRTTMPISTSGSMTGAGFRGIIGSAMFFSCRNKLLQAGAEREPKATAQPSMAGDPSGLSPAGPLSHADESLHGYQPGHTETNIIHAMYSINIAWVLLSGFLVMFMQTGFALLETGLCRAKNAAHTMS